MSTETLVSTEVAEATAMTEIAEAPAEVVEAPAETVLKFESTRSALAKALALAIRLIPARPTHPALVNFLVETVPGGGGIYISSFDLEVGSRQFLKCKVQNDGKALIPAKLLHDIITRLPDGEISIEVEESEYSLTAIVNTSSSHYEIRGMVANDYPELPQIEGKGIELPKADLKSLIRATIASISGDVTKQVLNGMHLKIDGSRIESASTDGNRLAFALAACEKHKPIGMTIPRQALSYLSEMIDCSETETIHLRAEACYVELTCGNFMLNARLIDGTFPNYQQLIPKKFSSSMVVERRVLLKALDRLAVVAENQGGVVEFAVKGQGQELTLSVKEKSVGGEAGQETLLALIQGDGLNICFNVNYLIQGLRAIDAEEIQMNFNSSTSPATFVPVGGSESLYLLMPIQKR